MACSVLIINILKKNIWAKIKRWTFGDQYFVLYLQSRLNNWCKNNSLSQVRYNKYMSNMRIIFIHMHIVNIVTFKTSRSFKGVRDCSFRTNILIIRLTRTDIHQSRLNLYYQDTPYTDVIMGAIASQITSLTIVYSTVYSDADQKNIKAQRHWPLCGEFTGDRWIPRTNGQ